MDKKKFLLLFVLCCALPLLAAKLVLEFGWFNSGVSSNGQWQQTEVFLLGASNAKAHWRLAVAPKADCDNACQQTLFTIQQLYIGLGRKQMHVAPVLISDHGVPAEYTIFTRHSALQPVPPALHDRILLIDQQGLLLLSYPAPQAPAELAITATAIRKDLLKLLNYDRTSV